MCFLPWLSWAGPYPLRTQTGSGKRPGRVVACERDGTVLTVILAAAHDSARPNVQTALLSPRKGIRRVPWIKVRLYMAHIMRVTALSPLSLPFGAP